MFVPLRKAVELTGLHPNTLRKYADNGTINSCRLPNGNRLWEVEELPGQKPVKASVVCYCRVSSIKQNDDLARQVASMRTQFPNADIIRDVGSGLNFRKKGLCSLLDRLLEGDRITLIVAHRDRLCRFGFDMLDYMVKRNGGEIVVLDKPDTSPQSELVQDVLSILHVFSCRVPGLRRYRDSIQKDTSLADERPVQDAQEVDGDV